ncbi:ATPase [Trypanosoma cruzi cruzi]|nr:ATPase [Trypanosoma cruzi cruzi]
MDGFSFLPFNCFLLRSSCEGCRVFPPNCSARTPTDTLMTTALCASPAARMRRAATCGCATRACGAEHTFLSLLFCFLAARAGRHPRRHTHTRSHTLPLFKGIFSCFACLFHAPAFLSGPVSWAFLSPMFRFPLLRSLSRWRDASAVMFFLASLAPTHKKSDCALRAALTRR